MKNLRWILPCLALVLFAPGCILTSGQFTLDFDLHRSPWLALREVGDAETLAEERTTYTINVVAVSILVVAKTTSRQTGTADDARTDDSAG